MKHEKVTITVTIQMGHNTYPLVRVNAQIGDGLRLDEGIYAEVGTDTFQA